MLFRSLYNNPIIQQERIQKIMIGFLSGIKAKLKSLDCDNDVFCYLFKGRGCTSNVTAAVTLNKEDFDRMQFPSSWYYYLNKNGEGQAVEFPIRVKSVLRRSLKHCIVNSVGTLVQAPTYIFEIVKLYITRIPCSLDSIK